MGRRMHRLGEDGTVATDIGSRGMRGVEIALQLKGKKMSDTRVIALVLVLLVAMAGPLMMLAMVGGCHV